MRKVCCLRTQWLEGTAWGRASKSGSQHLPYPPSTLWIHLWLLSLLLTPSPLFDLLFTVFWRTLMPVRCRAVVVVWSRAPPSSAMFFMCTAGVLRMRLTRRMSAGMSASSVLIKPPKRRTSKPFHIHWCYVLVCPAGSTCLLGGSPGGSAASLSTASSSFCSSSSPHPQSSSQPWTSSTSPSLWSTST